MIAGRRTSLLICLLFLAGCRWPDLPVAKRREMGTVYDTAYEKTLASGTSLPLLEQAWRDDAPVYAEPVAIRAWRDGVSTWDVFFATNRGVDAAKSTDRRERFGNDALDVPQYGRAEITLPRRRRGVDPQIATDVQTVSVRESATVDAAERLPFDEFLSGVAAQVERSRQRDVLLFVHGFNVDFDSALVRTSQIALDMPFNGAVVAYAWPTQGGVTNYSRDEPVNAASAEPFFEFLMRLRHGLDPDARIHVVVHSMGNRIVLQALAQMPLGANGEKPIDQLALCAPDVGLGDFAAWAPAAIERCRRTTLYASRHDAALIVSKGLHAEPRAGDAHPPVTLAGLETVDCSAIDGTSFLGHGYYSGNVDVLADLFMLLKRDRPAAERPHLVEKKSSTGRCWKYAGNAPHDLWTWRFEHLEAREAQAATETATARATADAVRGSTRSGR